MKKKLMELEDIVDGIFNQVNAMQQQRGSGLTFFYNIEVEEKEDDKIYKVNFSVRELGHGERLMQTNPYLKLKSLDAFQMKYQVLIAIMSLMVETSLVQWNELGKMLNTDTELQEAAKETLVK